MSALEPLSYWAKFKNSLLLSGPSLWLEKKLTPVYNAELGVIQTVKETSKALTIATSSGLKWGLILFSVIMALYLIGTMKSLTAAFKE